VFPAIRRSPAGPCCCGWQTIRSNKVISSQPCADAPQVTAAQPLATGQPGHRAHPEGDPQGNRRCAPGHKRGSMAGAGSLGARQLDARAVDAQRTSPAASGRPRKGAEPRWASNEGRSPARTNQRRQQPPLVVFQTPVVTGHSAAGPGFPPLPAAGRRQPHRPWRERLLVKSPRG